MNGDDLDKAQAMADALFPASTNLRRLTKRMRACGFVPGDPHLVLTENAYDAVQRLYLDLLTRSAFGDNRPAMPTTMVAHRKDDASL